MAIPVYVPTQLSLPLSTRTLSKLPSHSPLVLPPVTKLLVGDFASLLLHRGRQKLLVKSSPALPASLSWLADSCQYLTHSCCPVQKTKTRNTKPASPRMPHPHPLSSVSSLSQSNFLKAVSTFTVSLSFPPLIPCPTPSGFLPPLHSPETLATDLHVAKGSGHLGISCLLMARRFPSPSVSLSLPMTTVTLDDSGFSPPSLAAYFQCVGSCHPCFSFWVLS